MVIAIGILVLCIIPIAQSQTVEGNSDGMPCHFPFTYEGMTYTTCIDINHSKLWCSTTPDYDGDKRWGECMAVDMESLPSFDPSTPQNITIYQGETARLMCKVNNRQEKKVSWQLKGEQYPITVSTFSFLSSGRFQVEHDSDEQWNLLIIGATKEDSGIYQCRVTTQTMLLVREIHLTVQDRPPTVEPEITLGEPKVYVTKGKQLRLQCNSTGRYETPISRDIQVVPPEVEWFKGDGNKIDSHSLNRIVIHNRVEGPLRMSTLVIEQAEMDDAGVYICRNTDEVHAAVTVYVLNVDRDNKKRGTASEQLDKMGQVADANSAPSLITSAFPLLILTLLICKIT